MSFLISNQGGNMVVESKFKTFEDYLMVLEANTLVTEDINIINEIDDCSLEDAKEHVDVIGLGSFSLKSESVGVDDILDFYDGGDVDESSGEVFDEESEERGDVYREEEICDNKSDEQEEDEEVIIQMDLGGIEDVSQEEVSGYEDDEEDEYGESDEDVDYWGNDNDNEDVDTDYSESGIETESESERENKIHDEYNSYYENSVDVSVVDTSKYLDDSSPLEKEYKKEKIDKVSTSRNENRLSILGNENSTSPDKNLSLKEQYEEIPRTYMEYVKKHPYCDIYKIYQLYDKKEIDKAIRIGKLYKAGNRVYL